MINTANSIGSGLKQTKKSFIHSCKAETLHWLGDWFIVEKSVSDQVVDGI
jgi:hypothetical protein